jgi:hypothetical protein
MVALMNAWNVVRWVCEQKNTASSQAVRFQRAGFSDIEVHKLDAPLRLPSAADCLRFEQESFGALHEMLAGLDEAGRAEAWTEIESALAQFEDSEGLAGPCEMLVAVGTR